MTTKNRYSIEVFPVGSYQCNCSIIYNQSDKTALVVDPGDEAPKIIERIEQNQFTVKAIWHTHAHIDHIGATKKVYDTFSKHNQKLGLDVPKVYLHKGDLFLYQNVAMQAGVLGMRPFEVTSELVYLSEKNSFKDFESIFSYHTPGHTPGSCCLEVNEVFQVDASGDYFKEQNNAEKVLISGDTLFRGSVGRTDLWGGDWELLEKSIRKKVYSISDEALVIPGHGPFTSIAREKEKNQFIRVD